jgi:hypothetical protein
MDSESLLLNQQLVDALCNDAKARTMLLIGLDLDGQTEDDVFRSVLSGLSRTTLQILCRLMGFFHLVSSATVQTPASTSAPTPPVDAPSADAPVEKASLSRSEKTERLCTNADLRVKLLILLHLPAHADDIDVRVTLAQLPSKDINAMYHFFAEGHLSFLRVRCMQTVGKLLPNDQQMLLGVIYLLNDQERSIWRAIGYAAEKPLWILLEHAEALAAVRRQAGAQ